MSQSQYALLPSVDRLLGSAHAQQWIADVGHTAVVKAVRATLNDIRLQLKAGQLTEVSEAALLRHCASRLDRSLQPSLRAVINLTGTVLHTNLGRALLPREILQQLSETLCHPCTLEYDIAHGRRGERDDHVEALLCELTGAEAATVVNNNAAAVFLLLHTLARRKEVIVSRGELVEIGGSFRIPDIMQSAGCRLCEVGTTNRTHLQDYRDAVNVRTALLMKIHTSNYQVRGFTANVNEAALAGLGRDANLPLAVDLGSGALIDMQQYGLPKEPLVQDVLRQGAQLVSFSGDKLLGGPQAGIIVGNEALVARLKRSPLKRVLRVDKLTLAALEAVLRLYLCPEKLAQRLPTLRHLTRPVADIEAQAKRVLEPLQRALAARASIVIKPSLSEIGSGSLPCDTLPSVCLAIAPLRQGRGTGSELTRLATAFRSLPLPVIGRVEGDALCFDLRCLDDEAGFVEQLSQLQLT